MLKKRFLIPLVTLTFCLLVTASFAASQDIKLLVNGKVISTDVPPQLITNRVMVPIRAVAEGLGADVQWSPTNSTVNISLQEKQPAVSTQNREGTHIGGEYYLLQHNIFRDGLNTYVVGEIKNYSGKTHDNVTITVNFLDNEGNKLNSKTVRLPIDIQPKGTAYFSSNIYDEKFKVKEVTFELSAKYPNDATPISFNINNLNSKLEDARAGRLLIEGDMDINAPASRILAQVGVYDASGKLLSVAQEEFSTKNTRIEISTRCSNATKYSNLKLQLHQLSDR